MNLFQNKAWFLGVFTFVALFTGSSMMLNGNLDEQPGEIQFSDLSDLDVDLILAVKAEMREAKMLSN